MEKYTITTGTIMKQSNGGRKIWLHVKHENGMGFEKKLWFKDPEIISREGSLHIRETVFEKENNNHTTLGQSYFEIPKKELSDIKDQTKRNLFIDLYQQDVSPTILELNEPITKGKPLVDPEN